MEEAVIDLIVADANDVDIGGTFADIGWSKKSTKARLSNVLEELAFISREPKKKRDLTHLSALYLSESQKYEKWGKEFHEQYPGLEEGINRGRWGF